MKQPSLFSDPLPTGMRYLPELITAAEEAELIAQIRALPLAPYQYGPYTAHRKVLLLEDALPAFALPFRRRIAEAAERSEAKLTSLLFTYYPKGVGIGWHHDAPMYDEVFGISLLGHCVMDFRLVRRGKTRNTRVELERRSAYVLSGPARGHWQHRIASVDEERYSITFRSIAQGARRIG